jgi:hypothetical protein
VRGVCGIHRDLAQTHRTVEGPTSFTVAESTFN